MARRKPARQMPAIGIEHNPRGDRVAPVQFVKPKPGWMRRDRTRGATTGVTYLGNGLRQRENWKPAIASKAPANELLGAIPMTTFEPDNYDNPNAGEVQMSRTPRFIARGFNPDGSRQ